MSRRVVIRDEMYTAQLDLGGEPIDLADYATTGLRIVAIGPGGSGKTNAGLVCAEQLSQQGWISVLVDPDEEIESLYGNAMHDADELALALEKRDRPIVVVPARTAQDFVPYLEALVASATDHRQPIFLMVDEGQLFSSAKKRKSNVGETSDLLNDVVERGRKRRLDLFVTAQRYSSSLSRGVFGAKNLTLIGKQEDPTIWSTLATQFRGSKIGFSDLRALTTGQFFCFSHRGVEKVDVPMAKALAAVAPKARPVRQTLPTTFRQWDRAMQQIPTERLQALSGPVVSLLGSVAGLTNQQLLSGSRALFDELAARP